MAVNTNGLTSYEVPVQVAANVRTGAISIPLKMNGERYFKSPDKSALKLQGVPIVAKAFENVYATLGSPVTWPHTYNITLDSIPEVDGRPAYQLRGTYKRPSNVDHIFLDVDAQTFDPVRASWFYRNGASVVLTVQEGIVEGKYHLPQHETVEADFPGYHGSATIDYGTYHTNVPISDKTFSKPPVDR